MHVSEWHTLSQPGDGEIMRHRDISVGSIPDFLRALERHRPSDQPVWFRGQSRLSWGLKPSLFRTKRGIAGELGFVKRFKQDALMLVTHRPQHPWEWIFLMQHHGAPSRLLDWTESPLVGLYFAVESRPKADGAVWALLPLELNRIANIGGGMQDLPGFGDDDFLDSYLPTQLARENVTRNPPLAAIAPRNTPRMQGQLSVFTISHRDDTPLERLGSGAHVWRYRVPKEAKGRIRLELEALQVTRRVLFPELSTLGEATKRGA